MLDTVELIILVCTIIGTVSICVTVSIPRIISCIEEHYHNWRTAIRNECLESVEAYLTQHGLITSQNEPGREQ